jgi:hypothetical protein
MHQQYTTLESHDTALNTACVPSHPRPLSAIAKVVTVNVLAMILEWHPSLAMCLGRLVLGVCPNFRRA